MNRNQSFLQLCIISSCLMWSLSKAQLQPIQPGPIRINPFINTQDSQQPQQSKETINVKSPLERTLVSRLITEEQNTSGVPGEQPVKSMEFFTSLLQHLQTRRSKDQNFSDQPKRLVLTISDESSTGVDIEFLPSGPENFSTLADLLADSLAFVIQEAERLGFRPNFKYLVSLSEEGPLFSPAISASALKSAAG